MVAYFKFLNSNPEDSRDFGGAKVQLLPEAQREMVREDVILCWAQEGDKPKSTVYCKDCRDLLIVAKFWSHIYSM